MFYYHCRFDNPNRLKMVHTTKRFRWHRIRRRIWRHHLPLFLLSLVSIVVIYQVLPADDVIYKISMATAYPGLALLVATLAIGPWKVLRKQRNPVSDDLTRDVGIWAALVSLIHVVYGLQVHMRGRMWLLFLRENLQAPFLRFDLFGVANDTGVIATLILAMLLATSNDLALRALGSGRWKRLQRWNYGLFALVAVHGILYQVVTSRKPPFTYLFAAMGILALVVQLAGFIHRKRQQV